MTEPVPDQELLSSYRAGSEDAARLLFEKYHKRIVRLVRRQMGWRMRGMESSSEVALSALGSFFDQVQKNQVEIGPGDNLWPLLVTISLNKIRNRGKYWQRQRRDPQRNVPLDEMIDPLERDPSPDDAAVLEELVQQILEPFSGRRRRIIQLILEGHSAQSIAAEVGTTERTIYNTRQAAARILEHLQKA